METYFPFQTPQEAYENMTPEEQSEFLSRQVHDKVRELREDEQARERAGYTTEELIREMCDGI